MSFLLSERSTIPEFVMNNGFDEDDIIRVHVNKIVLHVYKFSTEGDDGDKERLLKVQSDHLLSQISDENLMRLRDVLRSSSIESLQENIDMEFSRPTDNEECQLRADRDVLILGGIVPARFDISTTGKAIVDSVVDHLENATPEYRESFLQKIDKWLDYRKTNKTAPSFSF